MTNEWMSKHRASQRRPLEQLTDEFIDTELIVSDRHMRNGSRSAESEALDPLFDDDMAGALEALPKTSRLVLQYASCPTGRSRRFWTIPGRHGGFAAVPRADSCTGCSRT